MLTALVQWNMLMVLLDILDYIARTGRYRALFMPSCGLYCNSIQWVQFTHLLYTPNTSDTSDTRLNNIS